MRSKKVIFLFVAIVFFQHTFSQFKYGIQGGGLVSANSLKSSFFSFPGTDIIYLNYPGAAEMRVNSNLKPKFSFYGGLVFDAAVAKGLSIRWKLLVENKGWRSDTQIRGSDDPIYRKDSVFQKEKFNLVYLSLPVDFIFYAPLKTSQLFFGAGFYGSYGISGHYKVKFNSTTIPELKDSVAEISFHNDSLHRSAVLHANTFDYGIHTALGIEFRSGVFIELNYAIGLNTIILDRYGFKNWMTNKWDVIFPNRNRNFSIGVGFFIK